MRRSLEGRPNGGAVGGKLGRGRTEGKRQLQHTRHCIARTQLAGQHRRGNKQLPWQGSRKMSKACIAPSFDALLEDSKLQQSTARRQLIEDRSSQHHRPAFAVNSEPYAHGPPRTWQSLAFSRIAALVSQPSRPSPTHGISSCPCSCSCWLSSALLC